MIGHLKKIQLLVSFLLLLLMFVGCVEPSNTATPTPTPTSTPTPTFQKTHILIRGVMAVGGDGEPIELMNNPNATNPTYAELLAFIKRDRTDEYSYIFGPPNIAFVCGDFAETIHNNAETAGIRAAWVGLDIFGNNDGHAINAFETTDLGLVFIDCTGKGLWDESPSNYPTLDRRARVKIGEEYSVKNVEKAGSTLLFMFSVENYREYGIGLAEYLNWLKTHDIKQIGTQWMQNWIQEHMHELTGCGGTLQPEPFQSGIEINSNSYFKYGWRLFVDAVEVPWFTPITQTVTIDNMPIELSVSWEIWENSWLKPVGTVKDIHIQW